jgi:hypothetical protein
MVVKRFFAPGVYPDGSFFAHRVEGVAHIVPMFFGRMTNENPG